MGGSRTSASTPVGPPANKEDSEQPGFLELVADAEDAFPLFNVVLVSFANLMEEIGDITAPSRRLAICRKLKRLNDLRHQGLSPLDATHTAWRFLYLK